MKTITKRKTGISHPREAAAAPGLDTGVQPILLESQTHRILAVDDGAVPRSFGGPVLLRTGSAAAADGVTGRIVAGGWHPDIPDFRDYVLETPAVQQSLRHARLSLTATAPQALPPRIDNRGFCSAIEDQGNLGSCTAQAVVGMMEYMMRRATNQNEELSRLFLYKVTRKLLNWTGDTGAYIRTTMKAVAAFGIPPERHWPYIISRFEQEPDAFLYAYASNYNALNYARLDGYNANGPGTLASVKQVIATGFAVAFGFPVYSSISQSPYVPYPRPTDSLEGGHAILAVGYDDAVRIRNADGSITTEGCLIFRNSWGPSWGQNGYGYLPYTYVTNQLAVDFWTVFKSEWLLPGTFS